MEEGRDMPTFKTKLTPHAEHRGKTVEGKLLQLADRSDVVVRPMRWERSVHSGYFRPEFSGDAISAEEFAEISKKHFDELATYGIRIPVSFVVADDDRNKKEVFAIVDNIEKATYPDKKQMGLAFAELRSSLLRYFTDKYKNKESFLMDLFLDLQYVYGKKKGDTEDHLYLIDIDARIQRSLATLHQEIDDNWKFVQQEEKFFSIPEYRAICDGFQALSAQIEEDLNIAIDHA